MPLTSPQLCEVATIKNKHLTKNKITMEENISNEKQNEQSYQTAVSSRLLLRVAADLQKELIRQTDDVVKADLEMQIEGLKALHKEVEDYRTIKRLLNGC